MTEPVPQPPFLDLPALLEASEPQQSFSRSGYLIAMVAVALAAAALVAGRQAGGVPISYPAIMLGTMIVVTGLMFVMAALNRRREGDRAMVSIAGELVQLRRWPQAAILLQQILSKPAPSVEARAQALFYLAAVMGRYHRFDDAIAIQNHLLDNEPLDDSTAISLQLARVLAMLRQDHLFDADRALSELRRLRPALGPGAAGFALVEIYRDVKTGHPAEAVEIFEERLPVLREHLGHRVADAHFLAAKAYDLLDRPVEAQQAYNRATLLAPLVELDRRYPEIASLREKYSPAPAPPEAA